MKAPRTAALVAGLVLATGLGVASAAPRATVPPYPGLIAFTDTSTGTDEIGVMRSDGSERRLLTTSLPLMARPAWSPDGRTLAFVLGHSIALADTDGTNVRRITAAARVADAPTWSRDGRLAFLRSLPAGKLTAIVVADAQGRHQRVLAREPAGACGDRLAWSRNGRDILCGPAIDGGEVTGDGRILSIAALTGSARVVHPPQGCAEPIERPGHPADVACVMATGTTAPSIWLVHGGRRVRRLVQARPAAGESLTDPVWNSTGSRLAVGLDRTHVAVVDVRGSGATLQLETIDAFPRNQTASLHVSWSPDGRSLAVGTTDGGWGIAQLDLATGDVRLLVQHAENSTARWSPDGTMLAYLRLTADGTTDLMVRPVRGSATTVAPVTSPGPHAADEPFGWSADSRSLAFVSAEGALDVLSVSSGSTRTLVTSGVVGGPAWSRDATPTLAYDAATGDGRTTVALIGADGSPALALPSPGIGSDPAWSPDGKLLYLGDPVRPDARDAPVALLGTASQTMHFPISASHVQFSPGDSRFLVAQQDGFTAGTYYRLAVIGSGGVDLASTPGDAPITGPGSWSPDGAEIAFPELIGTSSEIAITASSSLVWPSTLIARNAMDPSWGPDASPD